MKKKPRTLHWKHQSATLDLIVWENDMATVTNFEAQEKRQGHGTNLMRKLVEYLDEEKMFGYLEADPYQPEGMNKEQLVEFYERFGFQRTDPDDPEIMMGRLSQED